MSTASATTLPAQTVSQVVADLIDAGSLAEGARISAVARLADAAMRRGLDPHAPIDGDVLDAMVIDAIPAHLWVFA